jgi:hypothetical protein
MEKISPFWLAKSRAIFWNTVPKKFFIFLFFYFSNFLILLISKCDLRTWLHNFLMHIINKKKHTFVSFSKTSIFIVFEKLTRACFFPIGQYLCKYILHHARFVYVFNNVPNCFAIGLTLRKWKGETKHWDNSWDFFQVRLLYCVIFFVPYQDSRPEIAQIADAAEHSLIFSTRPGLESTHAQWGWDSSS